ncbi:alpha/beta fold hydrolase [soil metagenome]
MQLRAADMLNATSINSSSDEWFVRARQNPGAPARLFCFPHAGGAASAYYGWGVALPGVDVVAVQPPGREGRMREPLIVDSRILISRLADALEPRLDRPYIFFGHSMGALMAYEVALELRRRGNRLPSHLYVSGRRSPTVAETGALLHRLPDRELVQELNRRFAGMPTAITEDAELLALFLPIIRADVTLLETHVFTANAPLEVPTSAFGGVDDPGTTPELLTAWQALIAPPVSVQNFAGGHFYLHQHRADFLSKLNADLSARLQDILSTHDSGR